MILHELLDKQLMI